MEALGTRELKQNPHKAIQRVLDTGDEIEITAYGRPTGVHLAPDKPTPRRWVSGATLRRLPPISPQNAAAWRSDVDEALADDVVADPWERE